MLATLTRIAQAELLPLLAVAPLPRFLSEYAESLLASLKLPVVMPVSAAMAATALHLRLRYGESSDGLVTRRDAEVPGSVVVRPERRLDHAWLVFSTLSRRRAEADATQVCEALLAMLVEIDPEEWMERYSLEESLMSIFQNEEIYWRLRGRLNWTLRGDLNTAYFQFIANGRRRRSIRSVLSILVYNLMFSLKFSKSPCPLLLQEGDNANTLFKLIRCELHLHLIKIGFFGKARILCRTR